MTNLLLSALFGLAGGIAGGLLVLLVARRQQAARRAARQASRAARKAMRLSGARPSSVEHLNPFEHDLGKLDAQFAAITAGLEQEKSA
jgi:hypothetical protein